MSDTKDLARRVGARMSEELHRRLRLFGYFRHEVLPPQQVPDEYLKSHGMKTNDELASEMVDEYLKKGEHDE